MGFYFSVAAVMVIATVIFETWMHYRKPLVKCPCCDRMSRKVQTWRRNTQYVNDELNWVRCCPECFEHDWEVFQDLWDEYNRDRF